MGQGVTVRSGGPLLSPGVVAMQSAPPPARGPAFVGWIADRLREAGLEELADELVLEDARRRLDDAAELELLDTASRKGPEVRGKALPGVEELRLVLWFGPLYNDSDELVQRVELSAGRGRHRRRLGEADTVAVAHRSRLRETARSFGIKTINARRYDRRDGIANTGEGE